MLCWLTAVPSQGGDSTKEFPDKKCKVSLPGKEWVWDDPSTVPRALAVARHSQGSKLVFMAFAAPKGYHIDQSAITGFEKGLFKDGSATKESGKVIQFRGVPCYEVRVTIGKNNVFGVIRVLGTNDICYQLQLISDPASKEGIDVDSTFDCFDFTEPPVTALDTKRVH